MDENSRLIKWDLRFLDLCRYISEWSKDPSTKIGAVITNDIKIVSIGFNGLPQNVPDFPDVLQDREKKYKHIIHGEMNAILTASMPLHGCTLYTYPFLPCTNCASMVIQSGIKRVVSFECVDERWKDKLNLSKEFFSLANVNVKEYSVYNNT